MENVRRLALTRACSEADLKRPCHLAKLTDLDNIMFKSPTLDMTPKRKRKRHKAEEIEEDAISVQSMDVDTKKRRRSSLARMTSLSNLISPMKPVKKIGQSLSNTFNFRHVLTPMRRLRHDEIKSHIAQQQQQQQTAPKSHVPTPMRALPHATSKSKLEMKPNNSKSNLAQPKLQKRTLSLKNLLSPSPSRKKDTIKSYTGPAPTPPKRRLSTFWYETVEEDTKQRCTHSEMERQETIFEMFKNEEDLIEDLEMVKTTYHDSLCKLKLMTDEELKQVFGSLYELIPLHQDLVDQLKDQRLPDGTTEFIGEVLINWIPRLKVYVPYCANQVYARALLDQKKRDPAIDDFLQRCQESPFSRHLDLWSFLDIPRSRLVKYPLLLRNIQKKTDEFHSDYELLDRAVELLEEIIQEVDVQTGEAKCRFTYEKLEFIDEKQNHPLLNDAKVILCDGILKNNRGTKLHVFLFERILVLTRPATRSQKMRYQVYRQPIPIADLVLDDLQDGESKRGSFRSTFSQNSNGKNQFRVTHNDPQKSHSYTLQANDEHDKRQWVTSIRSVLAKERERLGIVATTDEGKDCVNQNRPITRSSSRHSFRLGRKGSTSSLTSMTSLSSIGSLSSLYSITSYESMADTDDSRSILSLSSVTSRATRNSTCTSPDGSILSSSLQSTPNKGMDQGTKSPQALDAETEKSNLAEGSPFISPTQAKNNITKRRRSTLTPPLRRSTGPVTRRSSYSPSNILCASPNDTVVDVLDSKSPDESNV